MPRIRKGCTTLSGIGAEVTGTCLTRGSVRETYPSDSPSYMASHGNGANSGAYRRSTRRRGSLRSCAMARLERYRPARAGSPNRTPNNSRPTSRRGVSGPETIRRVEAADASKACCQASCLWSNDSQSIETDDDASPTGDCTTWTSYCPGEVPRLIASSMTLNFPQPFASCLPAASKPCVAVVGERQPAVTFRLRASAS
jgi:hypothetical protein